MILVNSKMRDIKNEIHLDKVLKANYYSWLIFFFFFEKILNSRGFFFSNNVMHGNFTFRDVHLIFKMILIVI